MATQELPGRVIRVPIVESDPNQTTIDEILTGERVDPGPAEGSIQARFELFHRENPQVFAELVRLAYEWRNAGNTRCGIGMLFEVLRFQAGLRTAGDEFKLNNNYRSRYARLLAAAHPSLAAMFETRELLSPVILVKTKVGLIWNVLAFDKLTVTGSNGVTRSFQVDEIAEIVVDAADGQLSLLDGATPETEFRALQVVDGETGVPVRLVFPLELARGVGEKMAEGKIIVAKTLPPG